MFDFHIHVSPDGAGGLLPAEAMRLARHAGFRAVGLIARADQAGLPLFLPALLPVARTCSLYAGVEAFAGVELIHIPPALFPAAVASARELGASLVLGHGEGVPRSPAEAAERGTNLAAIEAGVDILAHPGLITAEDAARAAEQGVLLELTATPRHCLANGHVARMAAAYGCGLVVSGSRRAAADFVSPEASRALHRAVALGAGMDSEVPSAAARALVQNLLHAAS